MKNLRSDSSELEINLNPYVDAANARSWKHALRILTMSGSVLVADVSFQTPCLISQIGSLKSVDKSIDLLAAKAKTRIVPILTNATRIIIPKLANSLEENNCALTDDTSELSDSEKGKVIAGMLPELQDYTKSLMAMVIDCVFPIADLATVSFMKGLATLRQNHLLSGINEIDYELMIDELRRLSVIEPKVQINMCPECMNYELTISQHPCIRETCARCGSATTVVTLFLFKEPIGKLKSLNSDLPLFISAYLKQKLASTLLVGDSVTIYPLAELNVVDGENFRCEIDVYIPQLRIGIECKVYETPMAPMTDQRANGLAGEVINQMRRYLKAGVNEFIFISNLPQENLNRLKKALDCALQNAQLPLKRYEAISGDMISILGYLDSLAERIVKEASEEFSKNRNRRAVIQDINKLESQAEKP